MKKTLLALAVSGAIIAAPSYAVEAKIYGQVNRALISHDNGQQKATTFVDNNISGSRIGLTGSEKFDAVGGSTVEYGTKWEWQNQTNKSNTIVAGQTNDNTSANMDTRHALVYVKGVAGKVTLGKTDGAANGTAETDLSGTTVVSYSDAASDLLGGIGYAYQTNNQVKSLSYKDVTGTNKTANVANFTGQFDGLSRHDVLRYDSPNLGPVVLSASVGNGSSSELAATYAAELGQGHKLAAALGWADVNRYQDGTGTDGLYNTSDDGKTDRTVNALSVSYLANFGLNLTLSYSTQKTKEYQGTKITSAIGGEDKSYTYFKTGYNFGQHAVSLDYGVRDNDNEVLTSGTSSYKLDKAKSTSLAYVYKPASAIDLYASYRVESVDDLKNTADNSKLSLDDVKAVVLGGRVKF